jgi:multidrug efflux system membrane fusion protein
MRLRLLLPLLLVLAACGKNAGSAGSAPPPAPVVVGQVVRRDVPVSLRSIGNVAALQTVDLRAQVDGKILAVHFKEGADVAKGQALFTIDPEPYKIALAQSEASLARDQAQLQKAKGDVERYGKLVAKEYVTREQYETAEAQAASLAATIRADEAAVAGARLDLSRTTITAPIAGRVGTIRVDAGNLVKASGDPLVTILANRPVRASFSAPEKYLSEIRARQAAAPLSVRALAPGETGEGHAGTLTFIDNAVDRTTGTIRLEATFPNDDRALWPGQFVELMLLISVQPQAVVAPTAAIQAGQQGSYVFVIGQDSTAEMRPVVVDRALGEESVIAKGLEGGETVVTDGQLRVIPGAKVAVAPPQKAAAP